ncbi:antitoxin [Mycobacterium sp. RTGN5]|uniref:antitoxin n=1 Tax=Mycobacterium sp. RTGN5 TaxID=3016522 RepID=UPI0029C9AB20|nr:antitoxin [Mycobacterium sp. RTGN5]
MGFLDKALGKTKEVLSENADKVGQAIDKAGDIIDEKTKGKYSSTVDKVQDAAKNAVEKNRTDPGDQPT